MSFKTVLSIGCLALLTACSSTAPNPGNNTAAASENTDALGLKRVWMLDEWPGFTREQLLSAKAKMDLTNLPRGSAFMGCNYMMFQAEAANPNQAESRLKIGPVAATRKLCMDNMDLELAFGSRINEFTDYRLEGHRLILRNAKGETVRFVAQDWD
ncbi:MAG: META domain-containing protein [Neisseria sp.]|nr:META domain-containing protein [Neisseria sp.]